MEENDDMPKVEFINLEVQRIVDDLIKRGLHPLSLLEFIMDTHKDPIQLLRIAAFNGGYKVDF